MKHLRSTLYTLLTLSLLLALAGCQFGGATEQPQPSPTASPATSGQPESSEGAEGPATPPSVPDEPFVVSPPTDSSKANLGGTVLRVVGDTRGPLNTGRLYLGQIIYDADGNQQAAVMDDVTSPKADINEQGHFLFENVEPGEYALFYWTPIGSVMLSDPETGGDLLFDLKAGDTIDLGVMEYDIPY